MASFKKLYPIVFGAVLAAFTTYAVMDTFVIATVSREAEVNDSFVFVTVSSEVSADSREGTDDYEESSEVVSAVSENVKATGKVTSAVSGKTTDKPMSGTSARASGSGAVSSSVSRSKKAADTVNNNAYENKADEKPVSSVPGASDASNGNSKSSGRVTSKETAGEAKETARQTHPEENTEAASPVPETAAEVTEPVTEPITEPEPEPEPEPIPENDGRLYDDGKIKVGIKHYREYDTDIYVADVMLSSLEYFKTAFANNQYGKNIKAHTSDIARGVNAIFAVNGDYYGAREHGYVIRNGVLYRSEGSSTREALMVKADGSFEIVKESETSAQALMDAGAYQVISFGPGLVRDYNVSVSETDEVQQAMESNPRTAVGMIDINHYLFVVSDGRTEASRGLSLYELAGFMKDHGVKTAYNLDGGGSSSMYFQGEVINVPTADGHNIKERSVSDIVYIGY